MSDNDKLNNIRSKIKQEQKTYSENLKKEFSEEVSWSRVSQSISFFNDQVSEQGVSFVGKNLEGGKFSKEKLQGANFLIDFITEE